ncbi:Stomatal closure-related actin-binding protein 1-like protein [Drosera capensis]
MTRVTRDFASTMHRQAVPAVSSDVTFRSRSFPRYRLGADNQVVELKDSAKTLPIKEMMVSRESTHVKEQHRRMSVRDLASKFEQGLATASKLSEEDKLKEVASLEKHVLLKKLRDALEALKGCIAGKSKGDVEEAISMVEALAVQLAQREGELIQEKEEVKKLANFLKQASEDAEKLVEEERSIARIEIENAKAAVQRVEAALQEHEQISRASGKQDYEELIKEVQEARRIKMLHQPSRVMDMEHELRALRARLLDKYKHSLQLQKELAMKKDEKDMPNLYELEGQEFLGSYFRIQKCAHKAAELAGCSIQWYRVLPDGGKRELISGATKSVYAPEPFDVGRILQAEISFDGQKSTVSTSAPLEPAPGLGSFVEALVQRHDTEFNVVLTQMNGVDQQIQSIHVLHVGKMRMKLCKGKTTIAKEYYFSSMQLCGVRGGGNAAAQAIFWQSKPGLSFVLAFESERDRNAAIMLARRFAFDCNAEQAVGRGGVVSDEGATAGGAGGAGEVGWHGEVRVRRSGGQGGVDIGQRMSCSRFDCNENEWSRGPALPEVVLRAACVCVEC